MFMAELNVAKITEFNHSIIPPDAYWHKALQFFSKDVVDAMPTQIFRQKFKMIHDGLFQIELQIPQLSQKDNNQPMKLFDHCNSSHDEPLFLLLKGLAGCGKSYVIDAFTSKQVQGTGLHW